MNQARISIAIDETPDFLANSVVGTVIRVAQPFGTYLANV